MGLCVFRRLKMALKNMQQLHILCIRPNHIVDTEVAAKSASKASFQLY